MSAAAKQIEFSAPRSTNEWPIDYVSVWAWRQRQIILLRNNASMLIGAKEYYKHNPVDFINHWCDTYDPRNSSIELPTRMPFILFEKQEELVACIWECMKAESHCLIEKSRDMGATWVACSFSVWLWLFWPGTAIGWGSRKAALVDRLGDPDSIFEKMRMLISGLPDFFLPKGFRADDDMPYMKLTNRENESTITGEAGDNIGRGGRKTVYFKDESAWYERPEKIEAALGDNTRVQVDISSVGTPNNVFHRRRESGVDWQGKVVKGKTQVFVMDWRDHPAKDQEWYDSRKQKAEDEGLLANFAQEVDRDYFSSVEGIIIQREWVQAAIDAHIKLGFEPTGAWVAGLDIADEGGDTNALAQRHGVLLHNVEDWGSRDTAVTARKAVAKVADKKPIEVQYDSIGVGSGVKAEVNNLKDRKSMPEGVRFISWNAGAGVQYPEKNVNSGDKDSPKNKDFFHNLKAQGWWELRQRFYRTWRAVVEGAEYAHDDLISLDSRMPLLRKLEKELCQVTSGRSATMKMVIDKAPEGTKSPNLADAVMMSYWPIASDYDLRKFVNG